MTTIAFLALLAIVALLNALAMWFSYPTSVGRRWKNVAAPCHGVSTAPESI